MGFWWDFHQVNIFLSSGVYNFNLLPSSTPSASSSKWTSLSSFSLYTSSVDLHLSSGTLWTGLLISEWIYSLSLNVDFCISSLSALPSVWIYTPQVELYAT